MTSQTLTGHKASNSTTTDQTNSTGFLMLKRLSLLAGLLFCAPAFAAGNVPGFSLTPQFDLNGKVAPGCKLYVVQAGTTSTPQNAYQDTALTILHPNPLTCDAAGRLPQWFVADGNIKLRLTDRNGVQVFVQDNLLVIGPSGGGGGGGGTVDPTTILATGDFKDVYGKDVLVGFVRCNGRTIGSATSGATERANADTSALFSYLWTQDPNLSVSGGRGASGSADFAANKTITLPDCRGRVRAGLDDMGSVTAGRLTASYFGAVATTLGATGLSNEYITLFTQNLPPYTPSGSITNGAISITHNAAANVGGSSTPGGGFTINPQAAASISASQAASTFTGSAQGGTSTPVSIVQPTILITTYIKL